MPGDSTGPDRRPPSLIVFGGLPGVGKTTIARLVARRLSAVFLRIDEIEQAMIRDGIAGNSIGAAGYGVANAVAESNLRVGQSVVADCVNPARESRQAWRTTAKSARAALYTCEIVCSDAAMHRYRVESREADMPGHRLPTWNDVADLSYERWHDPDIVIDTARLLPDAAARSIIDDLVRC